MGELDTIVDAARSSEFWSGVAWVMIGAALVRPLAAVRQVVARSTGTAGAGPNRGPEAALPAAGVAMAGLDLGTLSMGWVVASVLVAAAAAGLAEAVAGRVRWPRGEVGARVGLREWHWAAVLGGSAVVWVTVPDTEAARAVAGAAAGLGAITYLLGSPWRHAWWPATAGAAVLAVAAAFEGSAGSARVGAVAAGSALVAMAAVAAAPTGAGRVLVAALGRDEVDRGSGLALGGLAALLAGAAVLAIGAAARAAA